MWSKRSLLCIHSSRIWVVLPDSENAEEVWQKSCCKKVETQYTAWNAFIFNERFNSFYQWVSTTKNGWFGNQLSFSVVKLTKKFALEEPTPIIDQMCVECTQHESVTKESVDKISCYLFATTKYCHGSTAQGQTLGSWESYILALRHEGPCGKCGDRCCESAQIRGTVIKHVPFCIDGHQITKDDFELWVKWPNVCARMVWKCLFALDQTSYVQ